MHARPDSLKTREAPARLALVFVGLFLSVLCASPVRGQIPDEFRNLQALSKDIAPEDLVQLMRSFSFATGLRCEGCHVMGEGGSFEGARFDLDDKTAKRQARYMIRMVERLNEELLPGLPDRDDPPLTVECKTCHRGIRKPFLLRTELHRLVDEEGIDAAVERYRTLRDGAMEDGTYDFGVWEMMELARELEEEGRLDAAVAMLELNEEVHPTASSIPRTLAGLYERLGRTTDALAAYARALGLKPGDLRSRERLRELLDGAVDDGSGRGSAEGGS